MSSYKFSIGARYTKAKIYEICGVPRDKQGGNWNTGYHNYEGDWFIFCNVGTPGRTGHDYENRFVGDQLHWFGKSASRVENPSIQSMLKPTGSIYVFHRADDRDPFTFGGGARAVSWEASTPVRITWTFDEASDQPDMLFPDEVTDPSLFTEGATRKVSVNVYERSPQARAACIEAHGCTCCACGFNFADTYGVVGDGFIHVHHLKQLADIGVEYQLDPVNDLRPVCPNCHAMLHRRRPPYSIDELAAILSASAIAAT